MRLLILSSLLMLGACTTPAKLPDPTIHVQPVPDVLLTPARKLNTMESPVEDSNKTN